MIFLHVKDALKEQIRRVFIKWSHPLEKCMTSFIKAQAIEITCLIYFSREDTVLKLGSSNAKQSTDPTFITQLHKICLSLLCGIRKCQVQSREVAHTQFYGFGRDSVYKYKVWERCRCLSVQHLSCVSSGTQRSHKHQQLLEIPHKTHILHYYTFI